MLMEESYGATALLQHGFAGSISLCTALPPSALRGPWSVRAGVKTSELLKKGIHLTRTKGGERA